MKRFSWGRLTFLWVPIALLVTSQQSFGRSISSLLPVADSTAHEFARSLAFDGSNYLVGVSGSSTMVQEACAQLVSAEGSKVGALIKTGRPCAPLPSAPWPAFGAGKYLLVWTDAGADHAVTGSDVYGQFVSTAGIPEGSPFVVYNSSGDEEVVGVASDGTGFLVVWSSPSGLSGRQVASSGSLGSVVLFSSTVSGSNAAVGYGGGQYLVAWMGGFDPLARLYSPAGVLGSTLVLGVTSDEYNPMNIAYGDDRFFVVWHHKDMGGTQFDLHGRFVLPAGTVVGASQVPLVSSGVSDMAFGRCLVYDGDYFLLTWTEAVFGASDGVSYGRYFDSDGQAKGTAFAVDSSTGHGFKLAVAVRAAKGRALCIISTDLFGSGGNVYAVDIDSSAYARVSGSGAGQVQLEYQGILESTTNLLSGFTEVTPQPTSPWTLSSSYESQFFRARREEDDSGGGSFEASDLTGRWVGSASHQDGSISLDFTVSSIGAVTVAGASNFSGTASVTPAGDVAIVYLVTDPDPDETEEGIMYGTMSGDKNTISWTRIFWYRISQGPGWHDWPMTGLMIRQ